MKRIILLFLALTMLFAPITAFGGSIQTTDDKRERIIFYPDEVTESSEKLPVIVWANGTFVTYTFYKNLIDTFVNEGFIVVASNESQSKSGQDQIANLDYVLKLSKDKNSVLYNKVDTNSITAMGHSQGGLSCVKAASADNRFTCVVSIAGASTDVEAKKLSTPTLFFTGTKDNTVNSNKYVKSSYNGCKGPAVYASLIGAGHSECINQPEVYAHYSINWINAWCNNDEKALATFNENGELANDTAWQDFSSKDLTTVFKGKAAISTTKYVYSGGVKSPKITVTDSNGNVIPQTNYSITTPSGRKNVGKYTYKITFKNNYSGSTTKSFTIVPKPTSISSISGAKKGFKLTWKKQATQTTGYQIQYSTSSKFTSPKSVTVSSNTTSKAISKLTAKKKYYVRIRTYKTVNSTKYYSSWSSYKTVTTK